MRQLVPTLFPFIELWKTNIETTPDQNPSDSKSKPKSI
jgi:hypothetical protein